MRAVVNGKRYDTQAPHTEHIAQWDNGRQGDDLWGIDGRLYRTGRGSWFLVGDGGAGTRHAHPSGTSGNTIGGTEIVPLSVGEAKDWLQRHKCVAALETYFGSEIVDA